MIKIVRSVDLREWVLDNETRFDKALLDAFAYTMRQRGVYAGIAATFDVAFEQFKNEVAA